MTARILIFCLLVSFSRPAFARPFPKWVSEKGYWQAETNIHRPWSTTIRFFNNDGILVYQENIEGRYLDLTRKKTLKRLKKLCDRAVVTWENGRKIDDKDMLVIK